VSVLKAVSKYLKINFIARSNGAKYRGISPWFSVAPCETFLLKSVLLLIFFTLGSNCFSQNSVQDLQQAYKEKSTKKLYQFCSKWQKEMPAISDKEFSQLSPAVKEAYNLFIDSYRKEVCDNYKIFNKKNDSSFIVLQNSIKIYTTTTPLFDRDPKKDSAIFITRHVPKQLTDSIADFRPNINCIQKYVYLSAARKIALLAFLNNDADKHTWGAEAKEKAKFLSNRLYFEYREAYLEPAFSTINYIIFDAKIEYAITVVGDKFSGGTELLHKENGHWKPVKLISSWED